MEDIVILDYSTGEAHMYQIDNDTDVEKFLKEKGFKESMCSYMIGEKIKLYKH